MRPVRRCALCPARLTNDGPRYTVYRIEAVSSLRRAHSVMQLCEACFAAVQQLAAQRADRRREGLAWKSERGLAYQTFVVAPVAEAGR